MSTRFDECFQQVVGLEGGYVDHPADFGGPTKYGIADAADGVKDGLIDGVIPVKDLTLEQAKDKYQREYWGRAKCNLLPKPLDLVVFDCAVNHGVAKAVQLLQRALGVPDDGSFGPMTKRALDEDVRATSAVQVALNVLAWRKRYYDDIIERNPSQKVFQLGWQNRVNHLEMVVSA